MASPEIFDIPIGKVVGRKGDTGNGIESIEFLSTSGLNKTYRITMTDGTTFDFVVTDGNGITGATFDAQTNELTLTFDNGTEYTTPSLKGTKGDTGNGIRRIEKTGTEGLVDTYTVTYTDGQTYTYTITNGADGVSPTVTVETITDGHRVTITDKDHPTGQSFDVMDGEDGASDAGDVTYDETATYDDGTVGSALNDLSQQISDVEDALDTKAPVIIETASGAIASFDDGADNMPIKKLVANIEPVQDLHGYDHPWPAGSGKNLANASAVYNQGNYSASDDSITVSGAGGYANGSIDIELTGGTTYTFSAQITSLTTVAKIGLRNKDGGSNLIAGATTLTAPGISNFSYTPDNNITATFCLFTNFGTAERTTAAFKNVMCEVGNTRTDYAPYSNICPISGWTGAEIHDDAGNLFDSDLLLEASGWVKNGDIYSGGAGNLYNQYKLANGGFPIEFKEKEQYTISFTAYQSNSTANAGYNFIFSYTDGTNSVVGGKSTTPASYTLTSDAGKTIDKIAFSYQSSADAIYLSNIMLTPGATAKPYEPYKAPNQVSVTFPSEAGTVYGGTLTINPDRTGTLVVDRAEVDLGTKSFSMTSGGYFYCDIAEAVLGTSANISKTICSDYSRFSDVSVAAVNFRDNAKTGEFALIQSSYPRYTFQNKNYSDVESFSASMNGVKLVYQLKNPVTYQLTESEISGILTTLYGQNNVWADTGDIAECEYPADTKLYIEQLTKPTEDDMTADHAISAGTFFMIGNSLYLATSQIAAGGTITPGTNATKLSLADALNQLNT